MMDEKNIWPGWETVRLIGRGSFGAVYEIRRDMLDYEEKAALKVITIPQNDSDINDLYSEGYDKDSLTNTFKDHLRSIIGEYSLMRKMNGSANIVNCDDVRYVQHDDGIGWDIYIKMELLTPLTSALTPITEEPTAIRIAKDLCHALVLCKRHDIVHRDIKPQNIFVSDNRDYKLGDFGIAKTVEKTSGGTKIGTYKYMAPEVYHNQPYGAGADIYSLGLVMYWMLNEWRLPFMPLPPAPLRSSLDEQARMRRFSGEPLPPPAHGSDALKAIVLKACAFDPKDRYQSAEEMSQALQALDAAPVHIRQTARQEAAADTEKQAVVPEADHEDATVGIWSHTPQTQNSAEEAEKNRDTIGTWKEFPQGTSAPTEKTGKQAPETQSSNEGEGEEDGDITVGIWNRTSTNPVSTQTSVEETPIDDGTVSIWGRQVSVPDTDHQSVKAAAFKVAVTEADPQNEPQEIEPEQPKAKTEISLQHQAVSNSQKPKKESKASAPKKKKLLPIAIAGAATVLLALVLGFIFTGSDAPESLSSTTAPPETNIALQEIKPQQSKPQETKPQETKPQETKPQEATQQESKKQNYEQAIALMNAGQYREASVFFMLAAGYKDSSECFRICSSFVNETIDAGSCHTVGLKADGTVVAVGDNTDGQCNVSGWRNIIAISAGGYHTVGLKADGTVVAVGDNTDGQCNVSGWRNIIAISASNFHTVGLKADGTVVSTGINTFEPCKVSGWTDIVAISASNFHTVGLKADGTVVAVGDNTSGQCNVSGWNDIVAISAGGFHTVGLKADGTVVAVGYNGDRCNVSGWENIIAISAGFYHTVGLKADGTVVVAENSIYGEGNVSGWKNIVAISSDLSRTVGLKSDGTVVAVGRNDTGECNISTWKNIRVSP